MNVQQFQPTAYISSKHSDHISARGLLNDWTRANCRTVSADEASIYLGYKAKSGGIWFSGHNTQFQFRPDRPWKSATDRKVVEIGSPMRSPFVALRFLRASALPTYHARATPRGTHRKNQLGLDGALHMPPLDALLLQDSMGIRNPGIHCDALG